MNNSIVILLTERSRVGDQIESAFQSAEFRVIRTDQAQKIQKLLQKENPDALVVNWKHANGMVKEITRLIQEKYQRTGLILFSHGNNLEEQIRALEDGADEVYSEIPKVDELVAKVKAIIRRISLVDQSPKTLKIKDININLNMQEVRKNGHRLDLTYTQFRILYLLASHRDTIFSRDEILHQVWGENAYVTDRTVDVHVKRLREKLGEKKEPLKYIQTIHGMGYRFA